MRVLFSKVGLGLSSFVGDTFGIFSVFKTLTLFRLLGITRFVFMCQVPSPFPETGATLTLLVDGLGDFKSTL